VKAQQDRQTRFKIVFGDSIREFQAALGIYLAGDGKQPQDGKKDARKIEFSFTDQTPKLIEELKSEYKVSE
jgi:hypothetical protein